MNTSIFVCPCGWKHTLLSLQSKDSWICRSANCQHWAGPCCLKNQKRLNCRYHTNGNVVNTGRIWAQITEQLVAEGRVVPSCVHGFVDLDTESYSDHVNDYWNGKRFIPQPEGPFVPRVNIASLLQHWRREEQRLLHCSETKPFLSGLYTSACLLDIENMGAWIINTTRDGFPAQIQQIVFVPPSPCIVVYTLEIWTDKQTRVSYSWISSNSHPGYYRTPLDCKTFIHIHTPIRLIWKFHRTCKLLMPS